MLRGERQRDEQRVSSWIGTFFIKVIWPIFGLGSIPGYAWRVASGTLGEAPDVVFFGVVVLLGFPAYYWLLCRRLRWVWLGPTALRVSSGLHEATVQLTDVADVRSYIFGSLIRVVLKYRTEVGQSFLFIPPSGFFAFREHPVARELRARAGLGQSQ